MANVSPEDVLALTGPTENFLCKLSDNTHGVEFLEFEVKDYDSGRSVFKVMKDPQQPSLLQLATSLPPELENAVRTIKYTFPEEFLRYKIVRTSLIFAVGAQAPHPHSTWPPSQPLNNFRMIERHYFKGELLRSYDFNFGFVIPSSTNSWEAIYPIPALSDEEFFDRVESPFESKSDSFYFVDDKLVMHNKAEYRFQGP